MIMIVDLLVQRLRIVKIELVADAMINAVHLGAAPAANQAGQRQGVVAVIDDVPECHDLPAAGTTKETTVGAHQHFAMRDRCKLTRGAIEDRYRQGIILVGHEVGRRRRQRVGGAADKARRMVRLHHRGAQRGDVITLILDGAEPAGLTAPRQDAIATMRYPGEIVDVGQQRGVEVDVVGGRTVGRDEIDHRLGFLRRHRGSRIGLEIDGLAAHHAVLAQGDLRQLDGQDVTIERQLDDIAGREPCIFAGQRELMGALELEDRVVPGVHQSDGVAIEKYHRSGDRHIAAGIGDIEIARRAHRGNGTLLVVRIRRDIGQGQDFRHPAIRFIDRIDRDAVGPDQILIGDHCIRHEPGPAGLLLELHAGADIGVTEVEDLGEQIGRRLRIGIAIDEETRQAGAIKSRKNEIGGIPMCQGVNAGQRHLEIGVARSEGGDLEFMNGELVDGRSIIGAVTLHDENVFSVSRIDVARPKPEEFRADIEQVNIDRRADVVTKKESVARRREDPIDAELVLIERHPGISAEGDPAGIWIDRQEKGTICLERAVDAGKHHKIVSSIIPDAGDVIRQPFPRERPRSVDDGIDRRTALGLRHRKGIGIDDGFDVVRRPGSDQFRQDEPFKGHRGIGVKTIGRPVDYRRGTDRNRDFVRLAGIEEKIEHQARAIIDGLVETSR